MILGYSKMYPLLYEKEVLQVDNAENLKRSSWKRFGYSRGQNHQASPKITQRNTG